MHIYKIQRTGVYVNKNFIWGGNRKPPCISHSNYLQLAEQGGFYKPINVLLDIAGFTIQQLQLICQDFF